MRFYTGTNKSARFSTNKLSTTEAERLVIFERMNKDEEQQWEEGIFIRMNYVGEEVEDEEPELVEDDVFPPHSGRYIGGYRI